MDLVYFQSSPHFEQYLVWPQICAYIFAHQALRACIWLLQRQQIPIFVCLSYQQKTKRLSTIYLGKPVSGLSLTSFVLHPRRCTSRELPDNWRFHFTSTELFTCSVLISMSSPGLTENSQRNACRWNFVFSSLLFFKICTFVLGYIAVLVWYADDILFKSRN